MDGMTPGRMALGVELVSDLGAREPPAGGVALPEQAA